jgi:hypothetical protein
MKRPCEHCGGTGVHSYFKGRSRFLLSQDECPACCGLGFLDTETEQVEQASKDDAEPPLGAQDASDGAPA